MSENEWLPFGHVTSARAARRALFERLAIDDAQVRTRAFVREHGAILGRAGGGLIDVLASWAESERASFAQAFGLPLAKSSFRHPDVDPLFAAVSSALHLAHAGHCGAWRARLARPTRFIVGQAMTDAFTDLAVDGPARTLTRANGTPAVVVPLPTVDVGAGRIAILGATTRSACPLPTGEPFELQLTESEQPLSDSRAALQEAVELIAAHAPPLQDWIGDVVHGLVPMTTPAGTAGSGSEPGHRGLLFATLPNPSLCVAEALVHEASHQYIYMAESDTLLTNGHDDRRYLSPYSNLERAIDIVLLGFHAFVHVALFYRGCAEHGVPGTERELASHLQNLRVFDAALAGSRGLTRDGRALYEAARQPLFG